MATWTSVFNTVPTQTNREVQGQNIIYALKTHLLAAGATVVGSSNGVAAAMDAVDRWTSSAALVWAAAASAHSWIVLLDDNGRYWALCCSTGATSEHLLTIIVSSTSFTGSSVTANPVPIDAANAQTWTSKQFARSTLTSSKYHTWRNDEGDWMFGVSALASGRVAFMMGSLETENSEVADGDHVLAFAIWNDAAKGAFLKANLVDVTQAAFWTSAGVLHATNEWDIVDAYGANTGYILDTITNAGSGTTGDLLGYPINVWGSINQAPRGTIRDLELAPRGTGINQFREDPESPDPAEWIILGEFWVPTNNTTLVP